MTFQFPEPFAAQLRIQEELRERERLIRQIVSAIATRLGIANDAFVALRLNAEPARTAAQAVEAFVRRESCALTLASLRQAYPVLERRLLDRIEGLYES